MTANRAYRPNPRKRSAAEIVNAIVGLLARLAALAFLAALAYTAYAAFGGALKDYPQGYTASLSNQLTHNMQAAGQVLIGSAGVFSVCLLILLWGWEWAGPLFILAGAALYVGMPYLAVPGMARAAMDLARQNHPGTEILFGWRGSGLVSFVAGGLFLIGWAWDNLSVSLTSRRKGLKVPFYSSCWQTHHCKDSINPFCKTGRKGFKASCWRYKSGCFCDDSIGDAILATARTSAGESAAAFFGPPAQPPQPTFSDRFRSTHHRVKNQKIACADCPIFNYHEMQKHRLLSPVIVVGIPALMYYQSALLHRWYSASLWAMDRFAFHLRFSEQQTTALRSQIHTALDVPVMETLVYIILAMVLITLAARALELWCFSLKL